MSWCQTRFANVSRLPRESVTATPAGISSALRSPDGTRTACDRPRLSVSRDLTGEQQQADRVRRRRRRALRRRARPGRDQTRMGGLVLVPHDQPLPSRRTDARRALSRWECRSSTATTVAGQTIGTEGAVTWWRTASSASRSIPMPTPCRRTSTSSETLSRQGYARHPPTGRRAVTVQPSASSRHRGGWRLTPFWACSVGTGNGRFAHIATMSTRDMSQCQTRLSSCRGIEPHRRGAAEAA